MPSDGTFDAPRAAEGPAGAAPPLAPSLGAPRPAQAIAARPEAAPPAVLLRLPPEKRGPLLRLPMPDHHVEIATLAGSELALLRLSDAIAEAAPTEGVRIHRSHWVARDAMADLRRDGARLFAVLREGTEAPVARNRAAAVRAAGLGAQPRAAGGIA